MTQAVSSTTQSAPAKRAAAPPSVPTTAQRRAFLIRMVDAMQRVLERTIDPTLAIEAKRERDKWVERLTSEGFQPTVCVRCGRVHEAASGFRWTEDRKAVCRRPCTLWPVDPPPRNRRRR